MPESPLSRLCRPESLTAIVIIAAAAAFLVPTAALRPISALLPAAMLVGLMVLSLVLLVSDQRKAAAGEAAEPMAAAPKRVIGAFLLIFGYAISVDFVGFYASTAVAIPLVAYAFGFRNLLGLVVATLIVVSAIYLVFDFAMSLGFPSGRLWRS
ncbi:tripartite tricarboxylate transporter TctB family protein [Pelagibius sp. 7325]|uniref:tripartite tricarboxylate transporter TctB family protein n=1 Tax=Pelagibius sp. 7325 TaxID=3131994 RepID=UPI0030ED4621